MQGTAKQIAWANDIRARWLPELDALETRVHADGHKRADLYQPTLDIIDAIRGETDATWWMQNRRSSPKVEVGHRLRAYVLHQQKNQKMTKSYPQ